jgi:glycine/sarcosine/dimethylglycine N-methyltransferase
MATKVQEGKTTSATENGEDTVRETDHYQKEYIERFVEKWDELIDWDARAESEGDFFIRELRKRGVRRVLDVATGTGFHSVRLQKAGFEVVSADGNPNMLARAFENARERGLILRCAQADWRWLNRDIHGVFDAVICLGNSFTHLHTEHDRRKALAEFYALLRHDGVLVLDQRNYDTMLDQGFSSSHRYYYCGDDVTAEPEYLDPGLARFRYEFSDGEVYHLNMFPLRKDYTRRLLGEVGFQRIFTYGDFKETYERDEPDFFVHVAEKSYVTPEELDRPAPAARSGEVVAVSRDYYNSSPADRFYHRVWGGEDIHIGLYRDDDEAIAEASRRTVDRMAALLPEITEETQIVDLGAGYGGAARRLVKHFGCHVTCLNLSEVQNRRNRRMNREQGLARRIDVVDGNFEEVPFPDTRFDVVWSQDSFLHSGDRERTLAEAARILRPGGKLVFTDPMQSEDCDPESLGPVLDRIHLDTMGTIPFYRDAAARVGLREEQVVDLTHQLTTHYGRVLQEIKRREDELVELCGDEYIGRMKEGLRHWIENGEAGNLRWGILLFEKVEDR